MDEDDLKRMANEKKRKKEYQRGFVKIFALKPPGVVNKVFPERCKMMHREGLKGLTAQYRHNNWCHHNIYSVPEQSDIVLYEPVTRIMIAIPLIVVLDYYVESFSLDSEQTGSQSDIRTTDVDS